VTAIQQVQCPIRLNASRSGEEEILLTPLKGVYIAMMMNTAPETASAQATRVTNTALVPRREEAEADEDEGQPRDHNQQ